MEAQGLQGPVGEATPRNKGSGTLLRRRRGLGAKNQQPDPEWDTAGLGYLPNEARPTRLAKNKRLDQVIKAI